MSSNIEITGDRLQCLRPGAWLNDEVILFVYYLFICLFVYLFIILFRVTEENNF